jgi:hypothetical protein
MIPNCQHRQNQQCPAATFWSSRFSPTNLLGYSRVVAGDGRGAQLLLQELARGRVKTSATRKPDWLIVAVVI